MQAMGMSTLSKAALWARTRALDKARSKTSEADAGTQASATQFSSHKPSTRSNSRRLLVIRTRPSLRAWAAMCRSFTPKVVPRFSSAAGMLPWHAEALSP